MSASADVSRRSDAANAPRVRRRGFLPAWLSGPGIQIIAVWLVLGSVLGEFAEHVHDYLDFDAGRYEHLAFSIARTHSLVPRINGVDIHYYSLLYPILLAPFFVEGQLYQELTHATVASAYLMASACIPAYLLTRRVSDRRWAPFFVGGLTVCMPWIITSMGLMTEVSSYPACTWALYAMVVAVSAPSLKHDLLAVLAVALAFFARGELITLALVFPLALICFALVRVPAAGARGRVAAAARALRTDHPVLSVVYIAAAAITLALYLVHRLASVIGIYGVYSNAATPRWGALPRALVTHLATFSLGVGVVPCVIALAWICANVLKRSLPAATHAFAIVSLLTVVTVLVQSTNFDLVVNGYTHDRFLMYFVPIMLIGLVLALTDDCLPRWSLVAPLLLIVAGFGFGSIPEVTVNEFFWLDLDTPVATVYHVFALHLGGLGATRAVLAGIALVGSGLLLAAGSLLQRRFVTGAFCGFAAIAMVFVTTWVFQRAFDVTDANFRPLTQSQHGVLDWVDGAVGPNARVTAIQYPVSSNWFVNQERWIDFAYFNRSLVRDATPAGSEAFVYLGIWYPELGLAFDAATGAVAESPTPWVVQSTKDARFQIAGPAKAYAEGAVLIHAGAHWHLSWLSSGLYDDGWTRPGVPVRIRVYPVAGQRTPLSRAVAFELRSPEGVDHSLTISSQGQVVRAFATPDDLTKVLSVCVPARGYAELTLTVSGSSPIPGDQASLALSLKPRLGGVYIASLSANDVGGRCSETAG